MFIIITYDVASKRVAKVMKTCRKYLTHVQKSVFEGMITEGKLKRLKEELKDLIIYTEDKICIYKIDNLKYTNKEQIGVTKTDNNIL
ncbi:MAG: CRISPR-associated endonuclease Cas2 [Lachnospiraceae bacterium]|nr:CRISPR-associated endonuclease Cas2 [Lachnospiraceae bacterium]